MKNFILFTIMLLLLLLIGTYLWNQYRPSDIKAECFQELQLKEGESYVNVPEVNRKYRDCLQRNGLEPEDIITTDTLVK